MISGNIVRKPAKSSIVIETV
ncbi:MAG: hypothetical protein F4180_08410 [Chloroflexi bacterium]|nr:hypothetical protein [Chloroflexota bacterium]